MSTAQTQSNKATVTRFQKAMSSGDWELISKTIDEVVEPDALIRTPLPSEATGAELLKEVFRRLHRGLPRPSHYDPGSDRGGGQGRRPRHGYWDPPRRVHGPAPNRQIHHV